jgi:hypothetical protein
MYRYQYPEMMTYEKQHHQQVKPDVPAYISAVPFLLGEGRVTRLGDVPVHRTFTDRGGKLTDLAWTYLLRNDDKLSKIEERRRDDHAKNGNISAAGADLRAAGAWIPTVGLLDEDQMRIVQYHKQHRFTELCDSHPRIQIGSSLFVAAPGDDLKHIPFRSGVRVEFKDPDQKSVVHFGVVRFILSMRFKDVPEFKQESSMLVVVDIFSKTLPARVSVWGDEHLPRIHLKYWKTICVWPQAIEPYNYMFLPCHEKEADVTIKCYYALTLNAHVAAV